MSRWGNCSTKASSDRPRAKIPHSYRGRPEFYLALFFGRRGRESQRQLAPTILSLQNTPQGVECFELNQSKPGSLPATKNHQSGLRDSEDESDGKIVSIPDSESGQQWAPHIQLEMLRFSKQGNPERGLVENNFGSTSLSQGDQSFPQHYYNGNVQVHNYSALLHDANLNAFQTFWPWIYFLHLIDVPWILLDCNFTQQIRLLRFQIFHSTNFTNGAHVMWFPICCRFCHIDFRSFCKIKIQ